MKRNNYLRLLSTTLIIAIISSLFVNNIFADQASTTLGAYDKTENFGIANDFNIFLFGDHEQGSVDAGGRVAVGGTAIYKNYTVGAKMSMSANRADLIIGGDVNVTGGMNLSGKTVISKSSKVINYTMINNNVQPARSVYSKENLIDFSREKDNLINDSKFWAGLKANGTVKVQHQQLLLEGNDKDLNVFYFNGSNIASSGVSLLNVNNICISVPNGSTVLINIKGDNLGFGSYAIQFSGQNLIDAERKTVWNFFEAKSLKSYNLSIAGSVLAPQADWKVVGSGNVEGNFIANSLKNEGGVLEAHEYLFNGHLPKNPRKRILLISIDGMHSSDLSNYIKNNPKSTLALLSNRGITYKNASTTTPTDEFPGILDLITGGSAISTGVFYHDSYDRSLLPPVSDKAGDTPGTKARYDENIDIDPTKIDGGGGINPDNLPRDKDTKQPVYPHDFLKVNTVFEVVSDKKCHTAWIDKNLAYDIVNGPSGKGVGDLYTPEIAANGNAESSITSIEKFDDLKVEALINEIGGMDHTGSTYLSVPTLFGMSFQAVDVGQKLPGNGYLDANGTMSQGLSEVMDYTDKSLGRIVEELKKQKLYDSTIIIISSKYGQSPVDPSKLSNINKNAVIDGVSSDDIAKTTDGDVSLVWLKDQSKTQTVTSQIYNNFEKAAIKDIYTFSNADPKWPYGDPSTDSRTPDIIVQPKDGVIYGEQNNLIASHGGFSKDDTSAPLLVSIPGIKNPRVNTSNVLTTQVAPTILKFLAIDPNTLLAVQKERAQVLPGIFINDIKTCLEAIKGENSNPDLYKQAIEYYKKANDKGYKVFVNGSTIDFSKYNNVKPVSTNGRTLVPLTAIAESLGAKVDWEASTKKITITSDNTIIELTLNSNIAYVNGEKQVLDAPAKSINGRVLVPLRFVGESFGETVGWYSSGGVSVISIY
ncbi:MAG: choice-of-anchor A family protein [Bacillota bacterium]|nr:choice-of-anchor A family protein [Bacillota bacterium]